MKLSEAQFKTLSALSKGERPGFVPPITRRWLRKQGLVTVEKIGKTFVFQITERGRIAHAEALAKKLRN